VTGHTCRLYGQICARISRLRRVQSCVQAVVRRRGDKPRWATLEDAVVSERARIIEQLRWDIRPSRGAGRKNVGARVGAGDVVACRPNVAGAECWMQRRARQASTSRRPTCWRPRGAPGLQHHSDATALSPTCVVKARTTSAGATASSVVRLAKATALLFNAHDGDPASNRMRPAFQRGHSPAAPGGRRRFSPYG
jgi:hypothetical protein